MVAVGDRAVMDAHSDSVSFFGNDKLAYEEAKALRDRLTGLSHPRKLGDVMSEGLDGYAAVFFPGGHAPMGDLIQDANVSRTLRYFHDRAKPIGLICHGPVGLIASSKAAPDIVRALSDADESKARVAAQGWPYAGSRMTVFSTAGEDGRRRG